MKVALVTGGNRGIGFAVCEALAQKGIKVLLGSRDRQRGEEGAKKLRANGLDVIPIEIDVSDKKSIFDAADKVNKDYGSLDILINNAAILPKGSLLEVSEEELIDGVETNLMGPIHCIRAFLPKMISKGYGRVVNVSSGWGSFEEGLDGPAVYSITKAALNAVTVSTAQNLPSDVKINSVCPGWVNTRMGGENATRIPKEGAEGIIWLAMLEKNGPNGKFFRDQEEIPW